MNAWKVILATVLGFVCGIVCLLLAKSGGNSVPIAMAWAIILNRTLIGFVIGISAWRIHFIAHGLLIGVFVSLSPALAALPTMGYNIFLGTLIMGAVYGLIINFVISLVFQEKKEATA
jgi:hypothetical protein